MSQQSLICEFAIGLCLVAVSGANFTNAASDDTRTIPLSEIVTTSHQTGLTHARDLLQREVSERIRKSAEGYLQQIQSVHNGSSNVFLVDATNISDAVAASYNVLVGTRTADAPAPVNTPDRLQGNHWLIAYLGSGPSTPSWWSVEGVTVDKSKIRLTFRKPPPSPATADEYPYYYWVPLGRLDPGAYEIELFDADRDAVALMRRVEVSSIDSEKGAK